MGSQIDYPIFLCYIISKEISPELAEKKREEIIMADTFQEPQYREDINPMIKTVLDDGYVLTTEEALFVYYIVLGLSNIEAYKRAGFTFPRVRVGINERSEGATSNDKAILAIDTNNADTNNTPALGGKEKEEDFLSQYSIETLPYIKPLLEDNTPINNPQLTPEQEYNSALYASARQIRRNPHLSWEISSRLEMLKSAQVADSHEVLAYFTAVMRGQVKDQFGLDASLQERTRAAECLAKRVIDLPKQNEKYLGQVNAIPVINIAPRVEEVPAEFKEIEEN